ncbi:type I restriction endonuclease subunit R, EcoR124 family [Rubritalea tangerina]|uniref:type I restriction endonuclease subunit R, EcoR124 family n=1 Tax=Rubritalea tangerina TaxID=430798 RepID=UPI00361A687D
MPSKNSKRSITSPRRRHRGNEKIDVPSEREIQDYRSTYNDTREWINREGETTTTINQHRLG